MISVDNIPDAICDFPEYLSIIRSAYTDFLSHRRTKKPPLRVNFNVNRAVYKFPGYGVRDTLLMYAVRKADIKFINALLSLPNINVNKRNGDGNTGLHIAIIMSQTAIVKRLLRVPGIDVNKGDKVRNSTDVKSHCCSSFPLWTAVHKQNLEIVLALLGMPININQRTEAGETAFSEALRQPNKDILILLRSCDGIIRKGKFVDAHGSFAVVYYDDDESNHTLMLGRMSNYDVVKGRELMKAVALNDISQISLLLQNPKIDINYAGGGPFQEFTDEDKRRELSEPIRNFIARWSHPHFSATSPGDTALWRAVIGENTEVVRMLLEHPHIDVNFVHGMTGKSILTHAIETRHSGILTLLLNRPEIDLFPLEFEHERHYFSERECCIPKTHFYPCGKCDSCDRIFENEAIQELFTNAYKRQGLYEKREILLEAYLKRQSAEMRSSLSPGFVPTFLETASQGEKLKAVRRLFHQNKRAFDTERNVNFDTEDMESIWRIVPTIHRIWLCSRDKNGDSLVHTLCKLPTHPTFCSLISERRIPINNTNKEGKSALIIAAEHNREDTVKLLLLQKGIRVPRDYVFPDNRSGDLIRKHLVIENEIKDIHEIEEDLRRAAAEEDCVENDNFSTVTEENLKYNIAIDDWYSDDIDDFLNNYNHYCLIDVYDNCNTSGFAYVSWEEYLELTGQDSAEEDDIQSERSDIIEHW
jgi:ankyrin repeat protein